MRKRVHHIVAVRFSDGFEFKGRGYDPSLRTRSISYKDAQTGITCMMNYSEWTVKVYSSNTFVDHPHAL